VGESTGRLALSLRRSIGERLSAVWLEVLPRMLYPLGVLFFLSGIAGFWLSFILPKIRRIFHDFGVELPALTTWLIEVADCLDDYRGLVILAVQAGFLLALFLLVIPGLRWHVPVLGRLYRMTVQSRVLKMLAVLLQAGKPVPEALAVLASSGSFPQPVKA